MVMMGREFRHSVDQCSQNMRRSSHSLGGPSGAGSPPWARPLVGSVAVSCQFFHGRSS